MKLRITQVYYPAANSGYDEEREELHSNLFRPINIKETIYTIDMRDLMQKWEREKITEVRRTFWFGEKES